MKNFCKNIYECHKRLKKLENIPEIIYGNFDCSFNSLRNLEGGPKIVCGKFDCSANELTTLRGGPKNNMYKESYDCFENDLTSLLYAPKIIEKIYIFENLLLTLDYLSYTNNAPS